MARMLAMVILPIFAQAAVVKVAPLQAKPSAKHLQLSAEQQQHMHSGCVNACKPSPVESKCVTACETAMYKCIDETGPNETPKDTDACQAKVLKLYEDNDKVTLRVEMDKTTTFTFESTDDDRVADFDLKTIEIEQEALGVPETEYEAVVKIPSNELKKAVADLKDCGDIIGMHASSEGLKLEVAGDIGTGLILLRPNDSTDEEEKIEVKGENDVCLGFGMRYIYLFTKASGLCKSCTLNLKNGEPMSLIYNLGEESHGHLKFVLAPKLSED